LPNTYPGQVSVREALQQSLNIPAVAVLERVGPGRVAARLRQVGIKLHWDDPLQKPGLPLALGGVGTTLIDLVTLYSGIANDGQVTPLRTLRDEQPGTEVPLFSELASWYLRRILESAPPPEMQVPLANTLQPRRIAHKTGTSYGFRDAWAIGFDQDYTVGIWSGRADGSPSPGRYGRNTAAPLLFRVFDLLPGSEPELPKPVPAGAIIASHDELPELLQYFHSETTADRLTTSDPLQITFPLDGSTVELPAQNPRAADLPLIASGGRRPLRWLVNGRPLNSAVSRREAAWTPDGRGLARITVIDKQGTTASAEVWISD
jgi:penicillin-binding protein 1C